VLAATALGSLTARFPELWRVHGAGERTLEKAVQQVSQIVINMLGLE